MRKYFTNKVISAVKPSVPKTKIQQKMGDLKKAIQKTKGSKAKLSQTIFELKNKMPLTFKKTNKKTMKESEKKKKIMKDNNKVIGRMFKKALEKK
jgi:hypothetical protein